MGFFSARHCENLVEFPKKVKLVKAWGPPGVLILRIVCSNPRPSTLTPGPLQFHLFKFRISYPRLGPTATYAPESLLLSAAILSLSLSPRSGQCLARDLTSLMGPRRVADFQFVQLCYLCVEWTGDVRDPYTPSQSERD